MLSFHTQCIYLVLALVIFTQTFSRWDDSRLGIYTEELSNFVGIINQLISNLGAFWKYDK